MRTSTYKGRQVFMETLRAHGVEYIFGNPGTTEMPILDSLLEYPDLRYIMTLQESIAVGAAHYYAQASGKTGVVSLHVAPGLGNGLGMLYNAYEANSPMLVTAGQQDRRMRLREPLLGHDLVAMAAPVVKWSVEVESADEMAPILHRALKIAHDPPEGPVFVALPIDVLEQDTTAGPVAASPLYRRAAPDREGIERAATLVASARRPVIVVGDGIARSGAQDELVALAELLGAPVYYEGLYHQVDFPTDHPSCSLRLPFDHAAIRSTLGDADVVLLAGGSFFEEVWFDHGSPFPDGARVLQIEASPAKLAHNFPLELGIVGDPRESLRALRERVGSTVDGNYRAAAGERNAALRIAQERELAGQASRAKAKWDDHPIAAARLMAEIRDAMPARTVVVNEAITLTPDVMRTLSFRRAGDYYGTRGGGIGQAVPGAVGVKLAHPDRPVLAISGDGSALYTIQALWTSAHHDLPMVWVILHNRSYRILKFNLDNYQRRFGLPGDRPYPHMDLTEPEIDFVAIARGFGVAGEQVSRPDEIRPALERAFQSGKPYLLDVLVDGRV
jgi:benzoylformate decarboxylase